MLIDVKAGPASWNDAYDPGAAAAYYEQAGLLTEAEFLHLFEDTLRVRMLEIPDLDWLLFDQVLSAYRSISLTEHYKAAARGLGIPYEGIEALYRKVIALKLMPAWTLNRTTFNQTPNGNARIGELMVSAGLMNPTAVERSLAAKKLIGEKVGVDVAVGQVFRTIGYVSVIDFFQLLGVQVGVPFESLDASAAAIFAAATSRHGLRPALWPDKPNL